MWRRWKSIYGELIEVERGCGGRGERTLTMGEFINTLPQLEQDVVLQKLHALTASATYYQFAINFHAECRLNDGVCAEFISGIIAAGTDPDSVAMAAAKVCRKYPLAGNLISQSGPTFYGRAITKERFCQLLYDRKDFVTLPEAHAFVDNLITKTLTVQTQRLGSKLLSKINRPVFATFNPSAPGGDPFAGIPLTAVDLCSELGLSKREQKEKFLLFVYSLPPGVEPRFPTIADAYAGDPPGWFLQFRVAPPGSPHGLIMPWDPAVAPRPEVVHAAIRGDTLEIKLREAR